MDVSLKPQQWVVKATGSRGVLLCWLLDAPGGSAGRSGICSRQTVLPVLPRLRFGLASQNSTILNSPPKLGDCWPQPDLNLFSFSW